MAYFIHSYLLNLILDGILFLTGWMVLYSLGVDTYFPFLVILFVILTHVFVAFFEVKKFNSRVWADLSQNEHEKERLLVYEGKSLAGGILIFTNQRVLYYRNGKELKFQLTMPDFKNACAVSKLRSGQFELTFKMEDKSYVLRSNFLVPKFGLHKLNSLRFHLY